MSRLPRMMQLHPDGAESGPLPLALAHFFRAEAYVVLLSYAPFRSSKGSMGPVPSKGPRVQTLSPPLAMGGFGGNCGSEVSAAAVEFAACSS